LTIRPSHVAASAALTCSLALSMVSALGVPADAAHSKHAAALRRAAAAAAVPGTPQLSTHVFARGNANLFTPDGIVVTKRYVFVVYQNNSDADVTKPSTIAKYDHDGHLLGAINLLGRCDGMRINPATHQLWALLNNDGLNGSPPRQPLLYTIDPRTLQPTKYVFGPTQPHGGGYDDIAFVKGHAYFSDSSPAFTGTINTLPVIVEAKLNSNGTVSIYPILNGNAVGLDTATGKTGPLNLTDPDSLAVDSNNNLVMVSEGDQQLAIVSNPGSAAQKVVRYGLGTGIDDITWTRGSRGTLLIADQVLNVIYAVEAKFPAGTIFAEATAGTPVASFIGTVNLTTSASTPTALTPLLTELEGIVDPTSLIFVRSEDEPDDQ
jgi:hypothetical protein